ncbi:MAG: hypothetical protein AAGC60_03600 [Acidobacteriota bacterium]
MCAGNPVIGDTQIADTGGSLEVTIAGADLGAVPGDLCVTLGDDEGRLAFVRVTSVSASEVVGTVGVIPAGMTSGRVTLAQGIGTDAAPTNVPAGFVPDGPFFSWYNSGQPITRAPDLIQLPAAAGIEGANNTTCAQGTIDPTTNFINIDISGAAPNCVPGTNISLQFDVRLNSTEVLAFDTWGALNTTATLPLAACITPFCNFLAHNIRSQTAGRLELACAGQTTASGQIFLQLFGLTDTSTGQFLTFVSGGAWMKIIEP